MECFQQRIYAKMFSRSPPQPPTVEVKDEINSLPREKIPPEEIHVTRIVPWVRLSASTGSTIRLSTFQLSPPSPPPEDLSDQINIRQTLKKCCMEEGRMELILTCYCSIPFSLYSFRLENLSITRLESPQQPCLEIKDEFNNGRVIEKHFNDSQFEDTYIRHPEIILSLSLNIDIFNEDDILQEPPVEIQDRTETVRIPVKSLNEKEIFEITLLKLEIIDDDGYIGQVLLEAPQTPDTEISDSYNKPSHDVKQLLEVIPEDLLTIFPPLEESSDSQETQNLFCISEPQPMEQYLEDSLNTPTTVMKNFFDIIIESTIIVPEGVNHSTAFQLEIEPFDTVTIPWEIEDNFKENRFSFKIFDDPVPDEVHLNVPWCYPNISTVTNITDISTLAPPQPPPSQLEDRHNVALGLRKIFNDSCAPDLRALEMSSDFKSDREIFCWSPQCCDEDVSLPASSQDQRGTIEMGNEEEIPSPSLSPGKQYAEENPDQVINQTDHHLDPDHPAFGSDGEEDLDEPSKVLCPEILLDDKPLPSRNTKKTFPGGKVPNLVIIFHPQKPPEPAVKKEKFILVPDEENLRYFLDEEKSEIPKTEIPEIKCDQG